MSTAITALASRAFRRLGLRTRRGDHRDAGPPAAGRRFLSVARAARPGRQGQGRTQPAPETCARPHGLRGRPGGRRRPAARAAWAAAGVTLALLAASAPTAYAATRSAHSLPLAVPRLKGAATLPQDLSGTLPNLDYGGTVGDFTGAGHDQLAYAQDGQLKIANVNKFGGQVVRQVPTDLKQTPNEGFPTSDGAWSVWDDLLPGYAANGATYNMTGVKVAASASNIYMAGATWDDSDGNEVSTYGLHLYKLPRDGSCASASCADKTADLPRIYQDGNFWKTGRSNVIVVTSLATGVVGGRTLIAVGLSDYGIYIFDDQLNLVTAIGDMGVPGSSPPTAQTPVTALAFGPPSGPGQGGVLAAGVESPWEDMFSYRLNPDGSEKSMQHAGGPWLTLASTVAEINGQLYAIYGTSNGPSETIYVINVDTDAAVASYTYPATQPGDQPTGLTPLTPWNGDPDNQEVVLGTYGGAHDAALQYVDGTLTAVPIGTGGATTGTADLIYQWFPGYGAGRLRVANDSPLPVSIALASRPDPGYGCWLNASVAGGAPAFPTQDSLLAAGATSPDMFAGALTAGNDGNCASAQGKGERSAYVVVTPDGDQADEHEIKIQVDSTGTMTIADQAGGYLTATLAKAGDGPGSWGTWELKLAGGTTPAAVTAPSVQGYRLTSAPGPDYVPPASSVADDPARPVYRFDVTGAQWSGVGLAGQVTARIPAMTAQGSTDGVHWQDLGKLMPSTAPVRNGDTVILGPASFFWQDTPGATPLTEVRVVAGGLASNVVHLDLASLPAPSIDGGPGATPLQGVTVTPDAPGGTAVPRADGVDQAGLTVKLLPSNGGIIQPSDPRYQLVYYRYADTNNLVTGLYTAGDYADYVAVGPYASNGSGQGQRIKNYLVTTSTAAQSLTAVLNDSGTAGGAVDSSAIAVAATRNPLTPTGTATGGIGITGCASSPTATCTLAVPTGTVPALYQAGGPADGPVTGLQLAATAITGRASLPLQVGTANVHQLGSAPLAVMPSQAKLVDTSLFFPSDTIDTALVTAGELAPALSIPVGNGG